MPVKSDSQNNQNGRLSSWKEIADYLNCDKRTCIRWEKQFSLPVHRIKGFQKSRVFAYRDEIDRWHKKISISEPDNRRLIKDSKPPQFIQSSSRKLLIIIPLVGILIGLFFFIKKSFVFDKNPADFRIDGTYFVALDTRGKEIWRYDTGVGNLAGDRYREHFQIKRNTGNERSLPHLIIRDINGDGRNEVLLSIQTVIEFGGNRLVVLDSSGRELWRYKTGRELTYGRSVYSDDFSIKGIDVVDLEKDGDQEILIIAIQRPEWPCQLTVLDWEGNKLGEYWNWGHFTDYALTDLTGDGREELLLTGIYNEMNTGFLAVFDPQNIHGCSPQQSEEFISTSLDKGTERYYLLIPRTDADLIKFPSGCLLLLSILANNRIQAVTAWTALYYEFGFDLRILDIKGSHVMEQMHKELVQQRLISSVLDAGYYENLKRKILYWDGNGWTTTPTMSNPW